MNDLEVDTIKGMQPSHHRVASSKKLRDINADLDPNASVISKIRSRYDSMSIYHKVILWGVVGIAIFYCWASYVEQQDINAVDPPLTKQEIRSNDKITKNQLHPHKVYYMTVKLSKEQINKYQALERHNHYAGVKLHDHDIYIKRMQICEYIIKNARHQMKTKYLASATINKLEHKISFYKNYQKKITKLFKAKYPIKTRKVRKIHKKFKKNLESSTTTDNNMNQFQSQNINPNESDTNGAYINNANNQNAQNNERSVDNSGNITQNPD